MFQTAASEDDVKARSFSHVGITVSNFQTAVRFYSDVFGCPLVGVADTPPDRVRAFFGVAGDTPTCKIGWVRVPGGGILEIFAFEPQRPLLPMPWNQIGLTHFSFNVRNTEKWYTYLKGKGVECLSPPERSPRPVTVRTRTPADTARADRQAQTAAARRTVRRRQRRRR